MPVAPWHHAVINEPMLLPARRSAQAPFCGLNRLRSYSKAAIAVFLNLASPLRRESIIKAQAMPEAP